MIVFLRLLMLAVLATMLVVTVTASQERGVFEAAAALWPDPWFRATLADAYFGFLTVFLWIAYKEPTASRRVAWFVLLMTLGNFAIAGYLLWQLFRLRSDDPIERLLLRSEEAT